MKACIENHFGAFEICCAHRVFIFFFNKLQLFHDQTFLCKNN